ncbi:hypothetical protein [Micromonospora sp. DT63]|uniref:hypothetical protein n=1 Tax=Micromonospora sp. DT63 TaxID=3393441 RepID=UPI003CEA56A8
MRRWTPAAPHLRASPLAVRFTAICPAWTANNAHHQLRGQTSAPLLVLNGRYDPATRTTGPSGWCGSSAARV